MMRRRLIKSKDGEKCYHFSARIGGRLYQWSWIPNQHIPRRLVAFQVRHRWAEFKSEVQKLKQEVPV